MTDLSHEMGGDLALSATGDLLAVSGSDATRQRVLRRLLTNQGGYVWHPKYGGGLPGLVGQVASVPRIAAIIRRQMKMERGVGSIPPPVVDVTADQLGTVSASVRYADQDGGTQAVGVL